MQCFLSLGDVVDLRLDFDLYHDQIDFLSTFRSEREAGFLLLMTNSIKLATIIIKKFEFDQERS